MSTETNERLLCRNEDHLRPTPAIARLSWPDGRYKPTTACVGDMSWMVRMSLDDGDPVLVEPATPRQATTVYLVWSNEHRAWWGPNFSGYTQDVWAAGRYDEAGALNACRRRDWPEGAPPPEVMVLPPEHGRAVFTVDDIRAIPELMRSRIAEATRKAVAEREQPVPAA
jgi:hypothetical protein